MQTRKWLIPTVVIAGTVVAAIIAARALRNPIDVEAPPPVVTEDTPDSVGPPAPSIVEAPILYDLGPAIETLEKAVARSFGNIDERIESPKNKRLKFAFAAARAPFGVSFDGTTVRLTTVVEYQGRGWYKPVIGPEVSAACGTGEVERPRLKATLVSKLSLTPEWEIATRTSIAQLVPVTNDDRDRCRVTVFRFDVTERVVNATREVLQKQLSALDRNIAAVNTRKRFESWWRKLQLPIRLTDSIYLTLNPRSAQLGKVTSKDRTVIANVRLSVQPQVVTGVRPNDFTLMQPIPPLTFGETKGTGMDILMEGQFTYPVASSLLGKALRGREVKQAGRQMVIRDVKLSGIGGGRVALAVDLSGDITGRVYFTGRPMIDTVTRQVTVPDLEYDAGSENVLVKGLEWLKGEDLRDLLRLRARLPDSSAVGRLIPLAEKGLNRQLVDGVVLRGKIDEAQGLRVRATTKDVRVYAIAKGSAQLSITRELPAIKKDVVVPKAKVSDPFRIDSPSKSR